MVQPADVSENVVLGLLTGYRIGGPAKFYAKPASQESLLAVLRWAKRENVPVFILGGGTNILVSDRGYAGLVIHLKDFSSQLTKQSDVGVWTVGAGVNLTPWVRRTGYKGFSGVEALIGIPGTMGGALRMNAGAFSQEISDKLISVEVIDKDLEVEHIKAKKIDFSYRKAPKLEDKIILSTKFQLTPDDPTKLIIHMKEIIVLRRNRQPLQWPSCGSVFKRPEGDYAGRLIEAAGLKGLSDGGAQIPDKHANFIVNRGGAKAQNVLELIKAAKKIVNEEFGIVLEREVILMGFNEEELEGT